MTETMALYNPPAFAVRDREAINRHIRETGLATLVTQSAEGPMASHLPLFLDEEQQPSGVLVGHLARGNPQIAMTDLSVPALAIFMAADAYVSPSWYPAKQAHGRVVPTWNYATVHARGRISFFEDVARLRWAVERLTRKHEAGFDRPWQVSDAPPPFVDAQLKGIVGLEIRIDEIAAKHKLSQNRSEADRQGVVAGLDAREPGNAISGMMRKTLEPGTT